MSNLREEPSAEVQEYADQLQSKGIARVMTEVGSDEERIDTLVAAMNVNARKTFLGRLDDFLSRHFG